MSEELYEPLPDLKAYLKRIGITHVKEPSPEFLDELVYAHQSTVPFDNLDVCERGIVPSLGIADLFDKIVIRKRGGFCFELNALFGALLKALGFSARPCMARVLLRPVPYPLISHRANIVTISGKRYLADVGFGGPQPTFAPLIEDGVSRTERGHTFTMHHVDHSWWEVGYQGSKEEERSVLRVCTMAVGEEDFVPLSFFQAMYPQSVFKLNRMANIVTESGALNLRNETFTVFENGQKTVTEIHDEEAVAQLLEEKFGIVDWR